MNIQTYPFFFSLYSFRTTQEISSPPAAPSAGAGEVSCSTSLGLRDASALPNMGASAAFPWGPGHDGSACPERAPASQAPPPLPLRAHLWDGDLTLCPIHKPYTDGKVLGSLTGCMDSRTSRLQGTAPPQFCAGRKKSLNDAPAQIKEEFCPHSFADIHKFGCIYDCSTISLTETQVSSPPPSPSRFFFGFPTHM